MGEKLNVTLNICLSRRHRRWVLLAARHFEISRAKIVRDAIDLLRQRLKDEGKFSPPDEDQAAASDSSVAPVASSPSTVAASSRRSSRAPLGSRGRPGGAEPSPARAMPSG